MVVARVKMAQMPSSRSTSGRLGLVSPGKFTLTAAKTSTIQRASSITRSTPARRSRSRTVGRSGIARCGFPCADSAGGRAAALPIATCGVTLIKAHRSSGSRR